MNLSEAKELIIPAFSYSGSAEKWADLGCGSGLFTNALATLLSDGSKIYAIDRNFQTIQSVNREVEIEFIQDNFEDGVSDIQDLDGILMANSLHYIREKEKLIQNLLHNLKPGGKFIIIEYDTENANQWVPYPVSFGKLKLLFSKAGFQDIDKTGIRKSVYNDDLMYGAVISGLEGGQ
ncbi:SAM-dependent methyltransferase [Chryseobacterium defluvii]|uniref:SAM-dependent methyltransferase n=1 Tax=Chryseobacterium defluvii TaxID=160396 RepID=A0A840K6Q4_9FLAO|nr:class I SAM-dependent methyltransferase [Chryseobacterium defluvii]MBB4804899.1 SAM-dependent methyltransferase [Chryseobacterium defluvii]